MEWSLYLKPEMFFSTFMRACFDFLGQKTGGEARSSGPSPRYRPGAKRSNLEFKAIYERISALSMDSRIPLRV